MSERMSTVFRHLSVWLRSRAIDPSGVEVTLTFDNRRGRDAAAFAIGKELEDHALEPKMPSHINEGTLMGIRFKLKVRDPITDIPDDIYAAAEKMFEPYVATHDEGPYEGEVARLIFNERKRCAKIAREFPAEVVGAIVFAPPGRVYRPATGEDIARTIEEGR